MQVTANPPPAQIDSAGLLGSFLSAMPHAHRDFLVSFERGEPDWTSLGIPEIADLPAVKWRQLNLNKLSAQKRANLVEGLKKALRQ